MTAAVRLLAEAHDAGLRLRVAGGELRLKPANANAPPDPELLDRLREHKAELIELLRGDRCRHCAKRLAWPDPVGVTFSDGTAACFGCYYRAAAARVFSPAALSDEAETLFMGELP